MINRALARLDRWFTAPVPRARLTRLRILIAGFAAVYLAARLPFFLAIADQPSANFDPVGVLSLLDRPPPAAVGRLIPLGALALSVLATTGWRWRAIGPAWAVSLLVLATWRSSWGQIIHHEHLLVLHALVLAAAPAGPARPSGDPAVPGWWLRLMGLTTVATYVLAGAAKLRLGGTDWLSGDTLRHDLASNALRLELLGATGSPWADDLAAHPGLLTVAAPLVVILELAAPLVLLGGAIRLVGVGLLWLMHVGIALFLWVTFPYPLFLIAFAPLFEVEQMGLPIRRPAPPG